MPTTTQLNTLNINKLTKAQYDELQNVAETDLYFVVDDLGITYNDLISILGYVPQARLTAGNGISIVSNVISIENGIVLDCGTSTTVI